MASYIEPEKMDFASIKEVYDFLDHIDVTFDDYWEMTRALKRLAGQSLGEDEKAKLGWEIVAFDFDMKDAEICPTFSSVTEDGITLHAYPTYEQLGDEGLAYIQQRAEKVNNPVLTSRYQHLLWKSKSTFKHIRQATAAINAYREILTIWTGKKDAPLSVKVLLDNFRNGYTLAMQTKIGVSDYNALINQWLFGKTSFPNYFKRFVIDFFLKQPQVKKDFFTRIPRLISRLVKEDIAGGAKPYELKDWFETGLAVSRKLQLPEDIWQKRLGDLHLQMAEMRMDDETRMVPLHFLKLAIDYFKEAGRPRLVKKTEKQYFDLKKELNLSRVRIPIGEKTGEVLDAHFKAMTDQVLSGTSESIYKYLLSGHELFAKKSWLIGKAKKGSTATRDLFTQLRFDINNNISKDDGSMKTKEKSALYENYAYFMQLMTRPLLHCLFIEGIIRGKITFTSLMEFMRAHSWLGQRLQTEDDEGNALKYSWLSLIGPSIHEYFIQTDAGLRSKTPIANYIMPIDSLTLKFEGVLRDFARLAGISTTTSGKRNVLREKYIEELLLEKDLADYFDEDDLLLFNYLFVAKLGMNLRNNIAHSFYLPNNYSFEIMHLLICAFLRIGKYRIET